MAAALQQPGRLHPVEGRPGLVGVDVSAVTPGDRVRHTNRESGEVRDGRLLAFKIQEGFTGRGHYRVQWALVQFRGRHRAYCGLGQLEVLK